MSTDQLAAVGVFLSGAASVVTGYFFVRAERRHLEKECQKRVNDIRRAYEKRLGNSDAGPSG